MNLKAILSSLILASAILCLGATSVSAARGPERAAKMSEALPRIEKTLVIRNGLVVLNARRAASLTDSERALAKVLVENLNGRIRRGGLKINQDLKVVSTAAGESTTDKDVNCDTHWWGEECSVDAATTQEIYAALKAGEEVASACSEIPDIGEICDLLELIGTALEWELEPCTDANDGSVFHYTWVGIPWFTCQ